MKYLIASIICTVLAALTLWLMGCREYQPFPEGKDKVRPPIGYIIHCQEYPNSIFCPQDDEK
jgi:hypothetical protein